MAVSNKDNPRAERPAVEQATAAPGEKRTGAPDRPANLGSEPEQPQRPGGVDGAADQAEARERMTPTPVGVAGARTMPAGESTDPVVQQLLAERETARLNRNEDRMRDLDKQLSDAGYTVA